MSNRFSRFLPLFAIATGVALVMATSAFKEAPKNKNGDTMIAFEYNAPGSDPNPYSQTNVETLGNWQYTSDNSACTSGNVKACKVYVSSAYVDGSGPSNYTLDPSYVITASSGAVSHVTATSDGSTSGTDFSNKPN